MAAPSALAPQTLQGPVGSPPDPRAKEKELKETHSAQRMAFYLGLSITRRPPAPLAPAGIQGYGAKLKSIQGACEHAQCRTDPLTR